MPAGTIALTNNSAAVTGTGTSFGTELAANDFIVATVGGVTYTLGIESVDSATVLTLIKAYDGPTVSGAAWNALPAAAMSLISAQTAADVARALRAANFDKVNWQQVFSELGDITVTLSDGSQFQGPSWRKISELLATLDVGSITEIAAQIHADAEQVATDKPIIVQAKNDAMAANAAAQQAEEGAQAADQSAQQSKADAITQAGIAKAEADRAKAEADRAAQSGVSLTDVKAMIDACFPVGVPIYWPTSAVPDNATYGIKFLRYNGGSFNTATYPKLAAIHPSGTLPDARADVIRVWDDSRGIDASRTLLSEQLDAAPEISGELTVFGSGAGPLVASATTSGAFSRNTTQSGTFTQSGVSGASYPLVFKASGSSTVYGRNGSTEMRMRNMALNFIVRAN